MTRRFPCPRPPLSPAARLVLITTPPVLLGSTLLVCRRLAAQYRLRRGYFGGLLVYWFGWCTAVPLWTLGPRRARALFGDAASGRRPTRVDLLALALPPLLDYTTAFPRAVQQASPRIVLASAALALVNATAEELLWRGAFLAAFPRHLVAAGSTRPPVSPPGTWRRSRSCRAGSPAVPRPSSPFRLSSGCSGEPSRREPVRSAGPSSRTP
jgi:hypothetical protein